MKKVYFPGLNALRFIAAFGVIVHHVEQSKHLLGLRNYLNVPIIHNLGPMGVSLFFVLSGFLITYLLLTEQEAQGSTNIPQFYLRRILKIWPLYYLLLFCCYFVFPRLGFVDLGSHPQGILSMGFLLYALMLPNVALAQDRQVVGISQGWSVGVEEQFYLTWPLLIRFFRRYLPAVFAAIIVAKLCYQLFGWHLEWKTMDNFMETFQIEKLTVGAIGAYLVFQRKERVLKWIYHPFVQVGAAAGILVMLNIRWNHLLYNLVEATIFCVLVLNTACNPRSFLLMENPAFNYLGKISYGIYMLHPIVITGVITYFRNPVPLYIGSIAITIGLSALSFEFFESYFLKLKARHSVILSGGK